MKWIDLSKAKNIEFNRELFLRQEEAFFIGKLVEIKHTEKGLQHTFEVATFDGEVESPLFVASITHYAIPK